MTTAISQETQDYVFTGRTFRPVGMSAWQVGYFAAHLRAAKADTYVLPSQAGHVESFDALVESLLVSQHLYFMLAAAVVEVRDGIALPWGNTTADEHARYMAGLTDAQDIAALRPMIWEVLNGFFPKSPASPATSPSCSSPTAEPPSHPATGASSTSAAGVTSPAPSPGTTGTGRRRSSRGPRAKSVSPTASD